MGLLLLLALLARPVVSPAQTASSSDALTRAQAIAAHVRTAPPGNASTNALHFSPDGSQIASYDGDRIVVWDVQTGEQRQTLPGQERYVYTVMWSPDGTTLASASVDGTVHLWDVATGERLEVLDDFSDGSPRMGGGITEVFFSPDGRYLAMGQRFTPGRLVVWDREAKEEVLRIERPRKMYGIDWSADGTRLYTAEENGTVYAWSFPGGEHIGEWKLERELLFDLDAADTRIATGGRRETVHVIDTKQDTVVHRFDQGAFVNNAAVVSGRPIVASVSSDGVLKAWDTDTGAPRYERFAHATGTWTVIASPSGRLLATTGDDNYIRLWDAETGDLVGEIRGQ